MIDMETKTIEEMESAVIQEINRLCPNDFNSKEIDHGLIVNRLQKGANLYIPDPDGEVQIYDLVMWFPFRDATPSQILTAYRWFGLEARDAVEAKVKELSDSMWVEIQAKTHAVMQFEAERARAAKLVEALEEIRKPATIIGFGKKATGKMRAQQLEEDHVRVRTIAKAALAAHKEGGVQG